jgi:hypothetical protein
MGASVIATWPGITEQQLDSQPGFFNDDMAWGNWLAEREDDPAVPVERAGGTILRRGEFCPGEPYVFFIDLDGYEVEIWYELPTPADSPDQQACS